MALPLLGTVVVLGVEIRDVARDSGEVRRQTALAVSADGPSRLLIGLQDEQAWATIEVTGLDSLTDLLVEGYDVTRQRDDIVTVSALRERFVRLARAIRTRSTGPYAGAGGDELFVDYTDAVVRLADAAVAGTFDGEEFVATVAAPPDDSYQAYRERVATILRDRADGLGAAAARRERTYIAMIVLTGALTVVAVVVVARSMTRPLRSLARQARHVTTVSTGPCTRCWGTPLSEDVQMPRLQEITVAAADEVGALAGVMNTVQHSVVALAVNQAVLRRHLADSFVSLGRRNQDLLGRQRGLIAEIQRGERDPGALLHLLQLDHLATRMRRNAESLLVLGGETSPRASVEPVGVVDVVLAALREVEHFPRVDLAVIEPCTIVGHAAGHLATRHGIQVSLQGSTGPGITAVVHLPLAVAPGANGLGRPPQHMA